LRDGGAQTYINFDVPETIALMSYYLMNSFPSRRFLLYGEGDLNKDTIASGAVILMPLFQMTKMPAKSVAITFTSHAISDLSHKEMAEYLDSIRRMTRCYLLYLGNARGADTISGLMYGDGTEGGLVEMRQSGWNLNKSLDAKEVEAVYRFARS
jgi:hypothetical protein